MNLFFEDMAKGRVSSTDEQAYQLGKDVAATPGTVATYTVWVAWSIAKSLGPTATGTLAGV